MSEKEINKVLSRPLTGFKYYCSSKYSIPSESTILDILNKCSVSWKAESIETKQQYSREAKEYEARIKIGSTLDKQADDAVQEIKNLLIKEKQEHLIMTRDKCWAGRSYFM
jgi:molybdopterin-biosynthesis enzyme MoeA-like protein